MPRFALALVSTVAGLAALLSYKTHEISAAKTPAAITATVGPAGTASSSAGSPGPSTSTGTSSPSASSSSSTSTARKTVTGDAIDTRWGPVQVRITVRSGRLAGVSAILYPTENPRDQEINATAVPALNQEALAAGSAKIDMISGATYTSQGYISSLQSALDRAGL